MSHHSRRRHRSKRCPGCGSRLVSPYDRCCPDCCVPPERAEKAFFVVASGIAIAAGIGLLLLHPVHHFLIQALFADPYHR